jgi:predicted dehydrogenase
VREPNHPYNSRRRDNAEHGLKVESSAGHQRRKRGAADCTAAPPSELPSAVLELANLYAAYARDISAGTRLAPTFADAVRMHAIIDLIEHSSKTGSRVDVPAAPLQLAISAALCVDCRVRPNLAVYFVPLLELARGGA